MIALVLNPVTILLATLCIHWVAFAATGPLSIQLPYFAFALLIIFAATGPRKIGCSIAFARSNALWLAPLAAYLGISTLVLKDTPISSMAPRQFFFMLGAIAFAGSIAATTSLPRLLRIGSALGVTVFVVAVELLARKIGLSWADAVSRFVAGDFNFVMFSFFRGVFNALDPTGEIALGGSTKNAAAVSLLVLAMLFRSGSSNPSKDLAGMALLILAFGLLLMLNTRSVLIAAGLALMMTTALGAAIRPLNNLTLLVMKLVGLLALLIAVLAFYLPEVGASTTLSDRFAFEDYSAESRIEQYRLAMEQIERSPLVGSGYFEANGHVIHNLFLAAWVQAGIVAFALVLMFYIVLILRWVGIVASVAVRPRRWILPVAFEWIAPLPILPMFRVWLSGDSGNMFFGEWIALAAFFGCVLANELMRRRLIRIARMIAERRQAVPPEAAATAVPAAAFAGVRPGVHLRGGGKPGPRPGRR